MYYGNIRDEARSFFTDAHPMGSRHRFWGNMLGFTAICIMAALLLEPLFHEYPFIVVAPSVVHPCTGEGSSSLYAALCILAYIGGVVFLLPNSEDRSAALAFSGALLFVGGALAIPYFFLGYTQAAIALAVACTAVCAIRLAWKASSEYRLNKAAAKSLLEKDPKYCGDDEDACWLRKRLPVIVRLASLEPLPKLLLNDLTISAFVLSLVAIILLFGPASHGNDYADIQPENVTSFEDIVMNGGDNILHMFDQTRWDAMALDERTESAAYVVSALAADLKVDAPSIHVVPMRTGLVGSYAARDNSININVAYLLANGGGEEILEAIAHEMMHCFQYAAIEDPAIVNEVNLFGVEASEPRIAEWEEELYGDYHNESKDYYEQAVEEDARTYASGVSQNLLLRCIEAGKARASSE